MVQLPSVQFENQNDSIFSTGQYVALVLKPEKTMDTLSLVPLSINFAINVLGLGGDGRTMRSEF